MEDTEPRLPLELFQLIISHLDYQSLVAASSAGGFLTQSARPRLYHDVDLRNLSTRRCRIFFRTISASPLLARLVRAFSFSANKDLTDEERRRAVPNIYDALREALTLMSNLECLSLIGDAAIAAYPAGSPPFHLKALVLWRGQDRENIARILHQQRKITELRVISYVTLVKDKAARNGGEIGFPLPKLRTVMTNGVGIDALLPQNNVKNLYLMPDVAFSSWNVAPYVEHPLSKLETLSFGGTYARFQLSALAKHLTGLINLHVRQPVDADIETIGRLKTLVSITLTPYSIINSQYLLAMPHKRAAALLFESCPNLQTLFIQTPPPKGTNNTYSVSQPSYYRYDAVDIRTEVPKEEALALFTFSLLSDWCVPSV